MLRNKWTGSLTIVRLRRAHPYTTRESEDQRGSFCDVDKFGLVPSELDHVKRRRPKLDERSLVERSECLDFVTRAETKLVTQCN